MSKLFMDVLAGKETSRRPLWIMRQAGRYLPEYRALRAEHTFEELAGSGKLAAEVTLQPFARFPFDAAIIFADLMTPVPAMGVPVRFAPGPVIDNKVTSSKEIDALRVPGAGEIAPEVCEALQIVKPQLKDDVALLGFAGAPLSIASYMVEGSGKKGFPALRALAMEDPRAFGKLLEKLSKVCAAYLLEQIKAGADAVQVFDSWGGLFSRADWDRLVRPHLTALLEELARHNVPRILYFNDGSHLLDDLLELPVDALSLDWKVDLPALRARGVTKVLQGNLDPALLLAGPETVRKVGEEFLAKMPRKGHLMNLGQGIIPGTTVEAVQAVVDLVHNEK